MKDSQEQRIVSVSTSIGTLFIRRPLVKDVIAINRARGLLGPDKGVQILSLLVSRHESGEPALSPSEITELTQEDLNALLPAVASVWRAGELPENPKLVDLEDAVTRHLRAMTVAAPDSFKAVVSPETLASFKSSLEGISQIADRMRLQSIIRPHNPFAAYDVESLRPPKPSEGMKLPDLTKLELPAQRAAKAAERTEERLGEMSDLLLKMGEEIGRLNAVVLGQVVPEYLADLEGKRKSELRAVKFAAWSLVISVLVSIVLTSGQVALDIQSGDDADKQAKALQHSLERQLSIAEQNQSRLERELDGLRVQVAASSGDVVRAIKEMPAPVVQVVSPQAGVAKPDAPQ